MRMTYLDYLVLKAVVEHAGRESRKLAISRLPTEERELHRRHIAEIRACKGTRDDLLAIAKRHNEEWREIFERADGVS